jgi:hypothetical protein
MVELFSTVSGARAADVAGGGDAGGATVVRAGVALGRGAAEVPVDGAAERVADGAEDGAGDAGDGAVETDGVTGAGAAPGDPESPSPRATTPTMSNAAPASATSTPTNRAPPGAASADRSRSTGGLPPGGFDTCVVPDAVKVPSSGRSPELLVRSSNV